MNKAVSVVMVLAVVVLFTHLAMAQGVDAGAVAAKKPGSKPGGIVVDAVSATATVQAVDAAARTVTLKLPDGTAQEYKVDKAVRNLDQVKVGDQVKVTYVESVALFVRKSSEKPSAGEVQTVQVAPKGAKPGFITTQTREITATAEQIDYAKRTVTLKGPMGNLVTYKVDKGVKRFKNVKAGDELVLRVTEAMAIVVEPAKQ